jgi:hypothetical protein
MPQVARQALIGGMALWGGQQPFQPSPQAARSHRQSMLADQFLLVPIPQVQAVQQQIQDGLRKLARRPG